MKPRFIKKHKSPLTSEQVLKEKRAISASTNMQHAKNMERRIAKVLKGRRQPCSGGMSLFKGDCAIAFSNRPNGYIVECKMSAGLKDEKYPTIRFQLRWLEKLEKDKLAMSAYFGVLILHYHNQLNDYVFWALKDIDRVFEWIPIIYQPILRQIINQDIDLDMTVRKDGTPRIGIELVKPQLDNLMKSYNNIKLAKVKTQLGDYLILRLSDFKDIVSDF